MTQEFKFSDPGEGLQEAEILEVHVSDGDTVEDGDTVLTLETDKANTDIPAPFSGTIEEVKVSEGDMVEIDDVLMTYNEAGESGGESGQAKEEKSEEGSDKKDKESKKQSGDENESDQKNEKDDKDKSGQTEKKKGKEQDVEKQDTEKRAESKASRNQSKQDGSSRKPVPAAPSTRRLAREKGVDLHDIEPSGENGRVTAEDVEAAASSAEGREESGQKGKGGRQRAGGSPLIPGAGEVPSLPDFSQWGETERTPLRSIRRATAQNMALSWGQIPHVYHQDIADITELERFRLAHEEAGQAEGGKFTLTVLMMKALVSVLKEFPRFNASLDVENQEIVHKRYFHIGLAVATDRGLLVPVIRDVDQKNLIELSAESADIARKTRNGEIKRDDMMGGSMTVTNPGALGGSSLTPLINHPQVAILGMAQARLEPVVHGDLDHYEIKPRLRLPLVLGFDHRVNDGADAAQFVTTLIRRLADPESLLLSV